MSLVYLFIWVLTLLSTLKRSYQLGRVILWTEETSMLVKVLYCKLLTIGKEPSTFPHSVQGLNHQPQRWEAIKVCYHCATVVHKIIMSLA